MGDPVLLNCVLAVCCDPFSDNQRRALTSMLVEDGICKDDEAAKVAAWVLKKFDLAEAGTLTELKASIAKLARGEDYKG